MPELARNRKKPRARTWTLEALDRDQEYRLYFDPESFRWEAVNSDGELVVTRVFLNRRSSYPPRDRLPVESAPGTRSGRPQAEDAAPGHSTGGRHRAGGEMAGQDNLDHPTTG